MKIETTPTIMTEMLKDLCRNLNPNDSPSWVAVIPESWALINECFPNVKHKIDLDGGSCVNGWAIWQWANMLITAEAHSVWQSEDGTLIDITPHNCGEQTILFVSDDNVRFEGKIIPNKRAPMTNSPKIMRLIGLLNVRDYMLEQSGTSRTCKFPEPFIDEINGIIEDVKRKASRNDMCPCGSGLKYKKCCGPYDM